MPGRTKGRYGQAVRLLAILERLRASRFPVRVVALAEEHSKTKRQIERDLLTIEECGAILEYTQVEDESNGGPQLYAAVRLRDKHYAGRLPTTRFHDPCGASGCAGELHPIVVEVSAERAEHVIARTFHPTQVIERLPNGRVLIKWQLCDWSEVVAWVLALGPHARAISPAQLVERVADDLRRARELYAPMRDRFS